MKRKQELLRLMIQFFPALIWLFILMFLSLQNGEDTTTLSSGIAEWLHERIFTAIEVQQIHHFLRKSAHIGVYLLGGVLLTIPLCADEMRQHLSRPIVFAVVCCTLLSVGGEMIKTSIPGRHCHWDEVWLNLIGANLGIGLGWLICRIWGRGTPSQ